MTAFIAIYGAILSTLIAFLQIRNFYLSQKFVHVQVRRWLSLEQETVEFIITNRANAVTEIREVMIGIFGVGGDAGFHQLWGSSANLFKGNGDDKKAKELEKPMLLAPGEAVVCNYSSRDAKQSIEFFSKPPMREKDTLSNLFYLEIEHSRARGQI